MRRAFVANGIVALAVITVISTRRISQRRCEVFVIASHGRANRARCDRLREASEQQGNDWIASSFAPSNEGKPRASGSVDARQRPYRHGRYQRAPQACSGTLSMRRCPGWQRNSALRRYNCRRSADLLGLWRRGMTTVSGCGRRLDDAGAAVALQPWGTSGIDNVPLTKPAGARWYLPWRYGRWARRQRTLRRAAFLIAGAKRRSNPVLPCCSGLLSRSLSSGAHSRDPLARNDEYSHIFVVEIRRVDITADHRQRDKMPIRDEARRMQLIVARTTRRRSPNPRLGRYRAPRCSATPRRKRAPAPRSPAAPAHGIGGGETASPQIATDQGISG